VLQDSRGRRGDVVELDIRGVESLLDFGIDFGVRTGHGGVKPLEISNIRPG
jgi:hypothetical protein